MIKHVYNLEFPSYCTDFNVFGFHFFRVKNYEEQVQKLHRTEKISSEFFLQKNAGTHSITANVEFPQENEVSIFEWADNNSSSISDILLLLSLFTGREVFLESDGGGSFGGVLKSDPRMYYWGGILRCSLSTPKIKLTNGEFVSSGFGESIEQIYRLIRSEAWQKEYRRGYYLLLSKMAFRTQNIESSFTMCWTIWEHLFSVLNRKWYSTDAIRHLKVDEKISFILVRYGLLEIIDGKYEKRIQEFTKIRNRLVHFGRFPQEDFILEEANLFIRLTEYIIAKSLGLVPSEVFNTTEQLKKFIAKEKLQTWITN